MITTRVMTFGVLVLLSQSVLAASGGGREAFFRCKDAKGQTHFSDSMPPECLDRDTEVLSERGSVIRIIEGADALAAKEARRSADEMAKKAHDDAVMRDRMLIEAYLSVSEIERLRDQRLALIDAQMRVDEQNMSAFKDREARFQRQVERYRPYNTQKNAPTMPDHFAEDVVNMVKSRDNTAERMNKRLVERRELEAKFASDIQRFRELKGIK